MSDMVGKRFTDQEILACMDRSDEYLCMSPERQEALRGYVRKKYPWMMDVPDIVYHAPKPQNEMHRIYGYTDDELKKILGTDEHPAEALRKYGLLPIYSALQSMQWRMDEMSRALSMIAEKMTEEDE